MKRGNVQRLGDRKDFWNMDVNPITGYTVPKVTLSAYGSSNEFKAEYNFSRL